MHRKQLLHKLKGVAALAFRHRTPLALVTLLTYLLGSIYVRTPEPPKDQDNLCHIFQEQPGWYDAAAESQARWGTPIGTQMAFVQQESAFQRFVRPPRTYLLGVIPWRRPSTAYGYAQAQDPAWRDYVKAMDAPFAQRVIMQDALNFIGWYNAQTHRQLGIPLHDAKQLYLAYHEGRSGYLHHSYRHKPSVQRLALQVAHRATVYTRQLKGCEKALRCRHFYQFWPFCR